MTYSTTSIRRWSLLVSSLGLIQGVLWFIGSFFHILLYYNVFNWENVNNGVVSVVYFVGAILSSEVEDSTIIIFMFVYAVLAIILCFFSSMIIIDIVTKSEYNQKFYISWSANMIILSVVDIVLTSFIGKDLSDIYDLSVDPPKEVVEAYIVVLIISIRGILIWILNVVSSGYMIVFASQLANDVRPKQNHVINAFEEPSGNWTTSFGRNPLAKSNTSKENFTFGDAISSRSYSSLMANDNLSINTDIFEKQENYLERLANIGKPGKRTPLKSPSPVNVQPPVPPPVPPLVIPEKASRFDEPSALEIELTQHALAKNTQKRIKLSQRGDELDSDYPYIPPPDYSPVGSPVSAFKSKRPNTTSTFF